MHESQLMEQVMAAIMEELKKPGAGPAGPSQVYLRMGGLAVHSAAATRQAFVVLARGTPVEQARLHLEIEPVTLTCPQCGFQGPLAEGQADPHDALPLAECPTCGAVSPVHGSRGVEAIKLVWD